MTIWYSQEVANPEGNIYTRTKVDYTITDTDDLYFLDMVIYPQIKCTYANAGSFSTIVCGASDNYWRRDWGGTGTNTLTVSAANTWYTAPGYTLHWVFSKLTDSTASWEIYTKTQLDPHNHPSSYFPWPAEGTFTLTVPKIQYTVSYNANGGTGSMASQTKGYNASIILNANSFVKTDYTFHHWNTLPNDTGLSWADRDTYSANASNLLYAIWYANLYFNANGGINPPATVPFWPGPNGGVQIPSQEPTRTNYVFKRWNTSTNDNGIACEPNDILSGTFTAPTTLYAIWNPIISYDANGGTGAPSAQTKVFNTNITLSSTEPTRVGYKFIGWSTSPNGIAVYAPGATYTSNDAVTLYAVWKLLIPQLAITSVVRCNTQGVADILGGCVKVSGTWEIINEDASQIPTFAASVTQDQWYSPSPVIADEVTITDFTVVTSANNRFEIIIGNAPNHDHNPDFVFPHVEADISVQISDTVYTNTAEYHINASGDYVRPTASIVSSQRCTANGTEDALGGYIKLVLSYAIQEATGAASRTGTFPITIESKGYEETVDVYENIPTGTITVILGNGTLSEFAPDETQEVNVILCDYFTYNWISLSSGIDSSYFKPVVGITSITRTDSNGNADEVGGYLKIIFSYLMYSSITYPASYAGGKINVALDAADLNAQDASQSKDYGKPVLGSPTMGTVQTETVIVQYAPYMSSGSLVYEGSITPIRNYIARFVAHDGYKSNYAIVATPTALYTLPAITSLTVNRADENGDPEDDGTNALVSVVWNIFETRSQTKPVSFVVELRDEDDQVVSTEDFIADIDSCSGNPTTVLACTVPGSDGLVSQDYNYTLRVTITDALGSTYAASKAEIIPNAYFPMDFLMGGHGVAFGKPCHRIGFDVGLKPYFDEALTVGERLTLPAYTYDTKPAGSEVPIIPAHIDCEDKRSYLAIENENEPDGVEFICVGSGNFYTPPAGRIMPYAGSAAPNGFLMCDGSAYSRTDYSELFAVIGTTYGAGDGSTTFNVPNLQGRVPVGSSNSYSLGSTGGEASHTLVEGELPSHVHQVPQHGHTYTRPTVSSSGYVANGVPSNGAHSHEVLENSNTNVRTFQNIYENGDYGLAYKSVANGFAGRCLIATDQKTNTHRFIAYSNGAHTHNLPNHTHTLTGGGVADKAAFDTNSTGSGQAHNNMQPYQVVNYIISTGKIEVEAIKGDRGTGVTSVSEVASSDDEGENVITLHFSDSTSDTFTVKNGSKGSTGDAAGFGTPTATVDSNVGTPEVSVTSSGPDTAKVFNFAFSNLKGDKGDKGDTGDVSNVIAISATEPDLSTTQCWIWINPTNGAMKMRNYVAPDTYTNGGWKWREIMFVDEGKNSETFAATTDTPSQ